MRRFVIAFGIVLAATALSPPLAAKVAVVDTLLDDHDVSIYIDPLLASGPDYGGLSSPFVGDINGDGTPDLVVSLQSANWGANRRAGLVWVYYGPIPDGEIDMRARPPDVRIVGPGAYHYMGHHTAVADLNGDGADDIAMAAGGEDDPRCPGFCTPSFVHIVFGGALPPLVEIASTPADVTIIGGTARAAYGLAARDFDGDGVADLLVASETMGLQPASSGILYGRPNWPPIIDLFTTAWDTEFSDITGNATSQCETSVAATGDLNGDGLVDVVVADPAFMTGVAEGGELLVWLGNGGRLPAIVPRGTADVVIRGEIRDGLVGRSFAVGDFDGDGFDDLALAAPSEFTPVTGGDAFVFYGRPLWPPALVASTEYDLALRLNGAVIRS